MGGKFSCYWLLYIYIYIIFYIYIYLYAIYIYLDIHIMYGINNVLYIVNFVLFFCIGVYIYLYMCIISVRVCVCVFLSLDEYGPVCLEFAGSELAVHLERKALHNHAAIHALRFPSLIICI